MHFKGYINEHHSNPLVILVHQ